jgi:hypothetical protein
MSLRNSIKDQEASKSKIDNKEINNKQNTNQCNTINIITQKKNDENKKHYTQIHPLDFYTLGKVHKPPNYTSFFCQNNAFRSTSNDLITRNLLSLNTCNYNSIIKTKNISTLSQQNIKENNYLKPLDAYKTYQKFNLPSNAINKELYNIEKEKIFVKSNTSSIKKGMYMTFTNFNNYKKKLLADNYPKNFNKTMQDIIPNKNLETTDTENNTTIQNKSNEIKSKLKFDLNNKNNGKVINKPKIKYINPIDYSRKRLKENFLYFDRNNKQFLRHKNWWIPDR